MFDKDDEGVLEAAEGSVDVTWTLVDGEYTCIFYTLDGEEIAQSTCEVELSR